MHQRLPVPTYDEIENFRKLTEPRLGRPMPFGEAREAFTWLLQLYFMLGGPEWHEHNYRVYCRLKRKVERQGDASLTEAELKDLEFLRELERVWGPGE